MRSNLQPVRAARLQWALTTQALRIDAYRRELDKHVEADRAANARLTLLLWVGIAVLAVAIAIARAWSPA